MLWFRGVVQSWLAWSHVCLAKGWSHTSLIFVSSSGAVWGLSKQGVLSESRNHKVRLWWSDRVGSRLLRRGKWKRVIWGRIVHDGGRSWFDGSVAGGDVLFGSVKIADVGLKGGCSGQTIFCSSLSKSSLYSDSTLTVCLASPLYTTAWGVSAILTYVQWTLKTSSSQTTQASL